MPLFFSFRKETYQSFIGITNKEHKLEPLKIPISKIEEKKKYPETFLNLKSINKHNIEPYPIENYPHLH